MDEFTCSSELIRCQLKNIMLFLNDFKWIIDAYISDFFREDLYKQLPVEWWKLLSNLQPEELASLLDRRTWKSREVWPLSLLAFRSVTTECCLSSEPLDFQPPNEDSNLKKCQCKIPPERCDDVELQSGIEKQKDEDCMKDGQYPALEHCYRKHVKPKKQHEIIKLGEVIRYMCKSVDCDQVVDVGAGQGHLARLLSFGYGIKVTTIEAAGCHAPKAHKYDKEVSDDINKGGPSRRNKKKQMTLPDEIFHGSASQPNHVVAMIDPNIPVDDFLQTLTLTDHCTPASESLETKFVLTGLHACGDLTATMLRVFVQCPQAVGLAAVGCCYMKLSQDGEDVAGFDPVSCPGYPMSDFTKSLLNHQLSYQAREMACHFVSCYHDRLKENLSNLRSHAYRAALQEIIHEKAPHIHHGCIKLTVKQAHQLPFEQYAEIALKKLNLNTTLTADQLLRATDRLKKWLNVVAFYTLRLSLAPLVETVILLDRALYLTEQGVYCQLVPIFDPKLSPRNLVLLAKK